MGDHRTGRGNSQIIITQTNRASLAERQKMNTVEQKAGVNKKYKPGKKTMILIYFYVILLLLIFSVVATYTWFALSRTPRVSNMTVYVSTHSGLELALDPTSEEWGNSISFLDLVTESAPLRPVTWSDKDQRFYAASYGIDGRLQGNWQPLSDERNANRDTYEGYYVLGTFYARTGQDVTVSLTHAIELEEGVSGAGTYLIGKPMWDSEAILHHNAGQGAENAVRIGIKITYLDDNGQADNEASLFYIYEPNCDSHTNGSDGYVETPSIDGTNSLVPSEYLIKQTHTDWTESDPVQNGVQIFTFGEFQTPVELFSLKKDHRAMIQLYIWLEGQDIDCTNSIEEAQILANIQFKAVPDNQSGLDPIE
jgi:hypothetical protein